MECGCLLDDLMPCDEPSPDCQIGYRGPSLENKDGVGVMLYPSPEAAEAAIKETPNAEDEH